VASALFTYRCSIACSHCLFGASPERADVVMSAPQCVRALALLHATGRVVHIAGGEPMLYWDVLADSVRLAHKEGHAPHFIETNCSFAADDALVRERLAFLAAHGVKGLLASADPFHQRHVPAERFLRVRRIAQEVFGRPNFWGSEASESEIRSLEAIARDEDRLRQYVRRHPPAMVGAAQRELARYLDQYAPDAGALPRWSWREAGDDGGCRRQFEAETLWELHIDPYGNIQTNCGMILATLVDTTPAALLAAGPGNANRFVRAVCKGGAIGLAEVAQREHGFALPERVAQTCDLCYQTRTFLRRFHPEVFGPEEVYA